MSHHRKKLEAHKQLQKTKQKKKKNVNKYKNLSRKKAPTPFNVSDIADTATVDYNNDTNITNLNDIGPNKNTNAQIAEKKKHCQKLQKFSKEKPYEDLSKKLTIMLYF